MPDPPKPYGSRGGVTFGDVCQAADALFRARERPTVEKIRARIGGGSPNTIGPLLDQWWATAAARLEEGPAAFHRLPESVAHICEALWLQALEEGRRHAAREQQTAGRKLATDQQQIELRSHVLTLREGELESRLRDRERDKAVLEEQLKVLTPLLRQEQATREAQARSSSAPPQHCDHASGRQASGSCGKKAATSNSGGAQKNRYWQEARRRRTPPWAAGAVMGLSFATFCWIKPTLSIDCRAQRSRA